jgi:stage II sporulation protein E
MTMKELTDRINSCFPKAFTPAAENRSIVGREKSYYIFWTCTRLICNWGAAGMIQQGQNTSGDSFRSRQLEDGRFIMALSDGMGSGEAASKESTSVVDLLLQFLEAGFTMDVALGLMNGAMIFGAEKERFSTLDVCLVDCHTGITELYKVGGHVSFLKHKNSVEIAEASGPPMGAGAKVDTSPNRCFLAPGESLVMVTDGVLEYLHVKDPAACLQQLIAELSEEDAAAFSRRILERVLLYTGGTVQDDMTILTIKIQER